MPQLIALAVAGTLAYVGYRYLVKQNARATARTSRKGRTRNSQQPRDLGELYWDEAAQAYRPRRRD